MKKLLLTIYPEKSYSLQIVVNNDGIDSPVHKLTGAEDAFILASFSYLYTQISYRFMTGRVGPFGGRCTS